MDGEHIESIRQNNFGIMLFSLVEDYEKRFSAEYKGAGFDDVRRPHGHVLRYLDREGTRISDIAQRTGITKQTIGKLVQELERLGYVDVIGIAGDGRVKLVRFSPRGRQLIEMSRHALQRIHAAYAEAVGQSTFERFEATLQLFIKHLSPTLPIWGAADANPYFHFGRFMVELAGDFEQRLLQRLHAATYPGIKPSYLALLFHLDLDGSRLVDLAQRIAVTPQAASLTISEMMRADIIYQMHDPDDQRARLILLTAHGRKLMETIAEAVEAIGTDYANLVGAAAVTRLRDCLLKMLRRLGISVFA